MVSEEDPVCVLCDRAQDERVRAKICGEVVECELEGLCNLVALDPNVEHLSSPLVRRDNVTCALIDAKQLLSKQVHRIVDCENALEFARSGHL